MKREIETAITLLSNMVVEDIESADALRFTQAALNLAHVLATIGNIKE
jgi:hypothetical protein|tara:strand:- start:922 stop:1065 length:144 start_codon:yes stop_codon:yes gene_type:complete